MVKYFTAVLLTVLIIGCLNPKSNKLETKITLEREAIYYLIENEQELFATHGGFLDDQFYKIPSANWYYDVFHPAVQNTLSTKLWIAESGDCDDFVVLAEALAIELNWSDGKASLPIGSIAYGREDGTGHVVVLFLYEEEGKAQLGFYDPQSGGQFIRLTKKERNQIAHWQL